MKKVTIFALLTSLFVSTFSIANEVNVFNARHYKADAEMYGKFTAATGIKVNLINGKSGALEKRIAEEGADSSADLYITADAGRCGAMDAKGLLQGGLSSATAKADTNNDIINAKIDNFFINLLISTFILRMRTILIENDYQSQ